LYEKYFGFLFFCIITYVLKGRGWAVAEVWDSQRKYCYLG
jgi:hypothetical protein